MHVTHLECEHFDVIKLFFFVCCINDVVVGWIGDSLGDFLSHNVEILISGNFIVH